MNDISYYVACPDRAKNYPYGTLIADDLQDVEFHNYWQLANDSPQQRYALERAITSFGRMAVIECSTFQRAASSIDRLGSGLYPGFIVERLVDAVCDHCHRRFTETTWELRHSARNGEDVHEGCCDVCDSNGNWDWQDECAECNRTDDCECEVGVNA